MGANEAPHFAVQLALNADAFAQIQAESRALEAARDFAIDSPEMAEAANLELRSIKARIAKLQEARKGFIAPAKQIIANAEALFDEPLESLAGAEKHIKGLLANWTTEQQRLADEARRKADEEARRARAEAEARAAADRARAEEQARKAREEAEAAERARADAEARARAAREAGDKEAAAKAEREAQASAAERARKEEEERQRIQAGEAKAAESLLAAAAAAPATTVAAPAIPKGFGMRDNWTIELEPGKTEKDAIRAIAASLAQRPDLIGLLKLDMSAAGKMAKATKADTAIPCMKAVNKPVPTSRAA